MTEVAERLGAGVAKALNGRAALPDDLPFVTGPIGLLGSKPSSDMMSDCDTLLIVGSNFPFADWLPDEGQARGVQIDLDGRRIGLRHPIEVPLVGDSRSTLRALLPMLERHDDRSWREQIERGVEGWWRMLEERAMLPGNPVNPMRLPGALAPPAGSLHAHRRLRERRQLVGAPSEAPGRDDSRGLRHAGHPHFFRTGQDISRIPLAAGQQRQEERACARSLWAR